MHDTTAVPCIHHKTFILPREELPAINKIVYFSDGAARTTRIFANLCNHNNDHFFDAEWHFFATLAMKKSLWWPGWNNKAPRIARDSLQVTTNNHILTSYQLYIWANQNIKGVKYFFASTS